jgi:SAM-dependent methyltransferase
LTLSAVQAESASAHAARHGIGEHCRFMVRSYDLPPPRRYDLILAIESLAHSADIERTIKNLAGALKPSGRIAVVDDVPDGALAEDDADFARFRRGWRCLRPPRASDFARAFRAARLEFEPGDDLTAWLRPRSLARIGALAALNRLAYALVPGTAARAMLDSYLGGLALERLYRRGAMTYRFLVARRVQ